jgi:hypothetical protein
LISCSSALFCAKGVPPTPFASITSALFPMPWRGEGISCPSARGSSLAPRHCKPCVCHTSERSPANPFICHTSKNGPPQVPCLPHLRYPRGRCVPLSPQFGTSSPNWEQAGLLVFRHQSPFTSHQSTPFVLLHALSRGATIGPERRKYWETKRLLSVSKKESGQRVRQALDAVPGKRSTLNGDVGRPETIQPPIGGESRVGKAGGVRLG